MAKNKRPHTPIVSKRQFKAMAAARSAMEGKTKPGKLLGASKEMYKSMKRSGPKSPKAHMEEVAGARFKKLPEAIVKKRKRKK